MNKKKKLTESGSVSSTIFEISSPGMCRNADTGVYHKENMDLGKKTK